VDKQALLLFSTLSFVGCSLLVNHDGQQCKTDADCAQFGSHPYCQNGVCVPSGLGPPGCFYGDPQTAAQFSNGCTTAQCMPFDNCSRLGECSNADAGMAPLVPPADLGAAPAPINSESTPAINCVDPSRPNLIFATGSTNFPPLLKAVAPLLAQNNPPYTVIYLPQTSCKGAGSMFDQDPTKHVIKDIPGNWAFFYDGDGNKNYCLLGPSGATVDVGESDVYSQTCSYSASSGIADYTGPIQAITFVVPSGSSQRSISAEAAHTIFGAGGNGGTIEPWTDPSLYFVRSAGTGTMQLPSRAIGVPPNAWWGIDRLSADNLRDSLEGIDPTSAEKAIGVLSSDFADRARDNLRVLMFQESGQSCGYLPDSSPTSFDKANVRDGHYPIWGPIHLFTQNDNSVPSLAAGALVTRFSVPRLEQPLLDAIVGSGYIPQCAMRVQRSTEMGALSSYQPQFGCGCYFESKVNGKSDCQACAGPGDCPSNRPACNYGFCEAQ
jgi:hypothetical protein